MSKAYNMDILYWDKFPDYDILYCDPPWGQRMLNFFETMMIKSGQTKPYNCFADLISHLAKLARTDKPLFIEYSHAEHDYVINIMVKHGHLFTCKVDSIQENSNPYCILVFNTKFVPDGSQKGFKVIDSICHGLIFNVVFDPFAGIGKTARKFIRNGKTYIGSEINESRFQKLKQVIWEEQQ